jgi:hypothetical protein
VIALPWYVLCYVRNGWPFVQKFFWEHQVARFSTPALAHGQPFWFFLPVIVAALFPWIPALALLFRRSLYSDSRRWFLLLWVVFGLVFFSASRNKLPSYILPLLPALAVLAGIAVAECKRPRWVFVAAAALLVYSTDCSRPANGAAHRIHGLRRLLDMAPAAAGGSRVGPWRPPDSEARRSRCWPRRSPPASWASNWFRKSTALPRGRCGVRSRRSERVCIATCIAVCDMG